MELPTRLSEKEKKYYDAKQYVIEKEIKELEDLVNDEVYESCDRHFIYDSYSCREGKGTFMGI